MDLIFSTLDLLHNVGKLFIAVEHRLFGCFCGFDVFQQCRTGTFAFSLHHELSDRQFVGHLAVFPNLGGEVLQNDTRTDFPKRLNLRWGWVTTRKSRCKRTLAVLRYPLSASTPVSVRKRM